MSEPITYDTFIRHFNRAEALVAGFRSSDTPPDLLIAEAQVHATLAYVAAQWLDRRSELLTLPAVVMAGEPLTTSGR
jgi:hypothetical protein